jgi:hypothetical protein
VTQVTLGGLTIWTRRDVAINSAHVVCGALVLATSLVLALRTWRIRFAAAPSFASAGRAPARARAALEEQFSAGQAPPQSTRA